MRPAGSTDHRIRLALMAGALVSFTLIGGWPGLVVVMSFVAMLTLHELGHFLVARWAGMQVTEFFLGFGPRLWSVQRGECTYGVKAIPAGAYVRITGMTSLDEVDPSIEHRTYRAQSYPRRLAVALAGSATHFGVALLLLFVLYSMVGTPDPNRWMVGEVVPDTAAEAIDLEVGDRILSVAGVEVDDFGAFGVVVRSLPGETVEVVVDRDGTRTKRVAIIGERLSPDGTTHGFFGVGRARPLVTVGPVAAAGEVVGRFGDLTMMSIDGLTSFFTPDGLSRFFSGALPDRAASDGASSDGVSIGVAADPESGSVRSPAVGSSTVPSDADDERLLSIYGAARLGSAMLADGWATYLWFLVLVNVFIGVFNLAPLLPLDGGHVAIATYERLRSFGGRRHRADAAKLVPVTWAVVSLLVLVGMVALYRDIVDFPDLG